jgi:hypothetical protein
VAVGGRDAPQPSPRPLREPGGGGPPAFAGALAANLAWVAALLAVVRTCALIVCMAALAALAALRQRGRDREEDVERAARATRRRQPPLVEGVVVCHPDGAVVAGRPCS